MRKQLHYKYSQIMDFQQHQLRSQDSPLVIQSAWGYYVLKHLSQILMVQLFLDGLLCCQKPIVEDIGSAVYSVQQTLWMDSVCSFPLFIYWPFHSLTVNLVFQLVACRHDSYYNGLLQKLVPYTGLAQLFFLETNGIILQTSIYFAYLCILLC